MAPGFLPFGRGSFVIDLLVVALLLVVPVFTYSLYIVKYKKNYLLHKRLQIGLAIALGIVVLVFEFEMRLFGWRHLAEPSPYFDTYLFPFLMVHLVCAITTVTAWALIIYRALKFFPNPPIPGQHSRAHKALAKLGSIGLYLTATTGWVFYYLAFVA